LNQYLKVGLVLLLLAGLIYGLTGLYFTQFAFPLLLLGIVFVGYGAGRPLFRRKRDRNERLLWNVGGLLVIIGLILVAFGFVGLSAPAACPAYPYQCPSTSALDELYTGTGLIIVGVGLMIASPLA
jgi:hypothetical protein